MIAIDGKSLRRSHDKKSFKSMLHSVAAWSVENCVVLGCQTVDQKSNEITAIPELLKKLELKGAIITMDAMGSQKDIAAQIVDGGGDYVLAIKDSVKKFASAVRAHWGIENSFHWVLDMTFNEDQSRIRKGHSPDNFALLRRFAINILSLDTSKESTRKKRKRAAWDENYLLNCLVAII